MDKISDMWYSGDEKFKDKYKYLVMLDMNKEKLEELSEKYMKKLWLVKLK